MKFNRKPSPRLALTIVLACGWTANLGAETLKPIEVFKRCYIRMVRNVPNEMDALYKEVNAGTKTADVACQELFDRAQFNASGVLKNRTDVEAKSILRTFHDLHSSWFQSKTHNFTPVAFMISDGEEAPLYFTRAAFQPNAQVSTVVTLNTGLRGVRDQGTYPVEVSEMLASRVFRYNPAAPYAASEDLQLSYSHFSHDGTMYVNGGVQPLVIPGTMLTEFGELVGVGSARSLKLPSFRRFAAAANQPDVELSVRETLTNVEANEHFGGGVIGSQAFFKNNANLTRGVLPNEYKSINRRITARVFEDLLCHQLPTLSDADVSAEVKPMSEHAFQQTTSCMRCHSSIDGMGYGIRNLFLTRTSNPANNPALSVGENMDFVSSIKPRAEATTFAAMMPVGRLHYRELVTGNRRDLTFNSLAQLGNQIAAGQDLYTCVAKRYYQFFTGVQVDLTQKAPAAKALDKLHQDKVLALGKSLKTHQSVRMLLKEIFASDAFRASDYLTEK